MHVAMAWHLLTAKHLRKELSIWLLFAIGSCKSKAREKDFAE